MVPLETLGAPPPKRLETTAVEELVVLLAASLGDRLLMVIAQMRLIVVPAVERVSAGTLIVPGE